MSVPRRMRNQIGLILDNLDGAAAYPPTDLWDDAGVDNVDYLYREATILARRQDEERVDTALRRTFDEVEGELPTGEEWLIGHEPLGPTRGIIRFSVPTTRLPLPDILDRLDEILGVNTVYLDTVVYVTGYPCPATEPLEVPPGSDPVPPPGLNGGGGCSCHRVPWPGCDGDGVFISIVDTGLMNHPATQHHWLAGVQGDPEDTYTVTGTGQRLIRPYSGHGTFVAGVARCMAPKASAYVERGFDVVGATFESDLKPILEAALDRNPDVFVFTFCTPTRGDQSLITFDELYETRIRFMKGMAVVSPAGNDGDSRRKWPAAYDWVLSVGALSANWRDRAWFTNYGKWVDVYAPGEDLINAFPDGTYITTEPPVGEERVFQRMAKWSGTSFSTPVVAGLIAARMSATGENGKQAADSLMRLACNQAVPGVGAVLYPGQACCKEDRCCH
jgi:Subtilase family